VRRLPVIGFACIATLALAVTALAGDGGREQVKFNAADQAKARAIVIRRSDLRPASGWKGGPTKPDLSPVTCANYHPRLSDLVITGVAETDWNRAALVISSEVEILKTARMVRLDWTRSVNVTGVVCAARKGGATHIGVSRMTFPQIAPYTAAYRLSYEVKANGQTIPFVFDFGAIGRGRTEISLGEITERPASEGALRADLLRLARTLVSRVGT
jgi:hypothetical protein